MRQDKRKTSDWYSEVRWVNEMSIDNPNLRKVCLDVKFTLPNVVRKQRSKAFKAVFVALYHQSDSAGITELDAQSIANSIGFCRQQVYRAIRFLERVNLLEFVKHRTGRGIHSIIKLNWRKSVTSPDPYKVKDKRPIKIDLPKRSQNPWNQKMRAFRELMTHSWFMPSEQRLCVALIGRKIKNQSKDDALRIYEGLGKLIPRLEIPNWVLTHRQLCAWFTATLNRIEKMMIGEEKRSGST